MPFEQTQIAAEVRRTVANVVEEQVWETVERRSRSKMLRVTGLEETGASAEATEAVVQLIADKMKLKNADQIIESAVRVGRKREDGRPRVILARCVSEQARRQVLLRKPNLKGSPVGVDEHRTPAQLAEHMRLVKMMKPKLEAGRKIANCWRPSVREWGGCSWPPASCQLQSLGVRGP